MTTDASDLMAEALKLIDLKGSFSPAEIGAKVGMTKMRAEAAARLLSNQGILVLGFDCAAEFSPDFRKAQNKPGEKETANTAPKARRRASTPRKTLA